MGFWDSPGAAFNIRFSRSTAWEDSTVGISRPWQPTFLYFLAAFAIVFSHHVGSLVVLCDEWPRLVMCFPPALKHPHVTLLPSSAASVFASDFGQHTFSISKVDASAYLRPTQSCSSTVSRLRVRVVSRILTSRRETSAPFAVCCDYQQSVGSGFNQSVL